MMPTAKQGETSSGPGSAGIGAGAKQASGAGILKPGAQVQIRLQPSEQS